VSELLPLLPSDGLLTNPPALRERLAEQGYLYLPGVLDRSAAETVRRDITHVLQEHDWLDPAYPPEMAMTRALPVLEGEEDFLAVYDDVQRLESFHALAHHPDIMRSMRAAVGETAFPHPLAVARLSFPRNEEATTPPHQDYPNNQGTEALYACWVPLMDCPRELGGLAVLPGSHKLGLMPLEFSLGPGGRQAVLSEEARRIRWHTVDYRVGDLLVFGSLTIHTALPNRSGDRFRLSVDYRYQCEGEALTPRVLAPHFGRLDWPEIYAGWSSDELQYYWRDKRFQVVPWDEQAHDLDPDHLHEAMRQKRRYDARRNRLKDD
jgi:ectoine hydroxylase-related dioxygenase (phytanoyl-CoA dioxygenase family)